MSGENAWPVDSAPCVRGAKPRAQRRYRVAKETKQRGKGGRKSECFILPQKRGDQPKGPRGGKGAPEHGNVRAKGGGDIERHKLERIAKLAREMPRAH
jgi:hypothetical protein